MLIGIKRIRMVSPEIMADKRDRLRQHLRRLQLCACIFFKQGQLGFQTTTIRRYKFEILSEAYIANI
jgi:hypothetical protein